MVVLLVQQTTFLGQDNQKLIMGAILMKVTLVIRNNIIV
jgi:hypothetical protein